VKLLTYKYVFSLDFNGYKQKHGITEAQTAKFDLTSRQALHQQAANYYGMNETKFG